MGRTPELLFFFPEYNFWKRLIGSPLLLYQCLGCRLRTSSFKWMCGEWVLWYGGLSHFLQCHYPILECWFESQHLCFQSSSLPRRLNTMTQVLGPLPHLWETQIESRILASSGPSPGNFGHLRSKLVDRGSLVCLSVSLILLFKEMKKKKYTWDVGLKKSVNAKPIMRYLQLSSKSS